MAKKKKIQFSAVAQRMRLLLDEKIEEDKKGWRAKLRAMAAARHKTQRRWQSNDPKKGKITTGKYQVGTLEKQKEGNLARKARLVKPK